MTNESLSLSVCLSVSLSLALSTPAPLRFLLLFFILKTLKTVTILITNVTMIMGVAILMIVFMN